MKTVIELADAIEFVRYHHEHWAREPVHKLAAYLAWHDAHGLLATSFVGDDLCALCTVRFFDFIEAFLTPWYLEPDGDFCMVDLLVSVNPLSQADCFEQLFKRWGPRNIVLWERGDRTEKSNGPPRMYTWPNFIKLARRMTYGAITGD